MKHFRNVGQSLLIFLLTICSVQVKAAIVDGVRQKPTPTIMGFTVGQEAYLFNTEAQLFFTQGNAWGTQASIGEDPRKVKFESTPEGAYTISCYNWLSVEHDGTYLEEAWRKVFIDNEVSMFVDLNGQLNYFWEVEIVDNVTFRILASSQNPTYNPENYDGYVGLDVTGNAQNTALSPFLPIGDGHYTLWSLVSVSEYNNLLERLAIYNKAQELKAVIEILLSVNGDITNAEAVYLNENATMEEIEAAIATAWSVYCQTIIGYSDDQDNVDLTNLLQNPDFEQSNEDEIYTVGWTTLYTSDGNHDTTHVRTGGTSTNMCYESYQAETFDVYQIIDHLPLGVYEAEVQGFYRYMFGGDEGWRIYQNQEVDFVKRGKAPVYIYINNNATPFGNIYDEPVEVGTLYQSSSYGEAYTDPYGQYWYPNEMYNSAIAFEEGMYKQSAFGLVAKEGDALRIGVKGSTNQSNGSWCIWDNFRLIYRGFKVEIVRPILEEEVISCHEIFDGQLMGKTEYAALTQAYSDAENAIGSNDGEAMFNALNEFYNAKEPALASKDCFIEQDIPDEVQILERWIGMMQEEKLSHITLGNAQALLDGIRSNTLYETNETSLLKSDINNMINALINSISLYMGLDNAINQLEDIIGDDEEYAASLSTLLNTRKAQYNEGSLSDEEVVEATNELNSIASHLNTFILSEEWQILQTAYQQMGSGEGWYNPWVFETTELSAENTPGVTTRLGHVTSIDLSYHNISNGFPVTLLSLPYLESLYISGDHLQGDIGEIIAEYLQSNPTVSSQLERIDISNNNFTGNIGKFASCFPHLQTLYASKNFFEEVSPMISPNVTTLDLQEQSIDRVVALHLADLSDSFITNNIPNILLYDHNNQTFTSDICFRCQAHDNNWVNINFIDGQLSVYTQQAYQGESGDTLTAYNSNGWANNSTISISLCFDEGDGNFDGKVNVLDLQTTLNYMFEDLGNKPFNFTASNLWKDDIINVQDAVCLVNILLDMDATQSRTANRQSRMALPPIDPEASVFVDNGLLTISSAVPISSFDLVVTIDQSYEILSSLNAMGFVCTAKLEGNILHLVGYSLSGATLPAGQNAICRVGEGTVTYVMLSDKEANEIKSSYSGTTTMVSSSILKSQPHETYRLPLGGGNAIRIDATGKKTIIKNAK